jgi:hypothetical protein
VHFHIRVIRRRVFYPRDLVAKLSGITNSCLHARVCYESHDDELMDAGFLELQILHPPSSEFDIHFRVIEEADLGGRPDEQVLSVHDQSVTSLGEQGCGLHAHESGRLRYLDDTPGGDFSNRALGTIPNLPDCSASAKTSSEPPWRASTIAKDHP